MDRARSSLEAVEAERWRLFGLRVLDAHHRFRRTQQCSCGALIENCAVLAAADRSGLPVEDPAVGPGDPVHERTDRRNALALLDLHLAYRTDDGRTVCLWCTAAWPCTDARWADDVLAAQGLAGPGPGSMSP